jgi:hypothetical protein
MGMMMPETCWGTNKYIIFSASGWLFIHLHDSRCTVTWNLKKITCYLHNNLTGLDEIWLLRTLKQLWGKHCQLSQTETGGETRWWTRGIFIKVYINFTSRQKTRHSHVALDLYRRSNLGRREEKFSWFSSVPPGKRRDNIFTGPQLLNCKLIIHQSPIILRSGETCLRRQGQPRPP